MRRGSVDVVGPLQTRFAVIAPGRWSTWGNGCGIASIKPSVGVVPQASSLPPEDPTLSFQQMAVQGSASSEMSTGAHLLRLQREGGIRALYRGFAGNFETTMEMLALALAENNGSVGVHHG